MVDAPETFAEFGFALLEVSERVMGTVWFLTSAHTQFPLRARGFKFSKCGIATTTDAKRLKSSRHLKPGHSINSDWAGLSR